MSCICFKKKCVAFKPPGIKFVSLRQVICVGWWEVYGLKYFWYIYSIHSSHAQKEITSLLFQHSFSYFRNKCVTNLNSLLWNALYHLCCIFWWQQANKSEAQSIMVCGISDGACGGYTKILLFSLSPDLLDFSSICIDPIVSITPRKSSISLLWPIRLALGSSPKTVVFRAVGSLPCIHSCSKSFNNYVLLQRSGSCFSSFSSAQMEDIFIVSWNQVHVWPKCLC